MPGGEICQVHEMRGLIVGALLGRDEVGMVERGIEAGRLDACRTCRLLRIGGQLHIQRANIFFKRHQVEPPHATTPRQTAQRERPTEHRKSRDFPRIRVVQPQIGTLIVESDSRQDRRMVIEKARHKPHPPSRMIGCRKHGRPGGARPDTWTAPLPFGRNPPLEQRPPSRSDGTCPRRPGSTSAAQIASVSSCSSRK